MPVQKKPVRLNDPVDMNGDILEVGFAIIAYYDGQEYTGIITGFENFQGSIKRVVIKRDGDGVTMKSFSDAVVRDRSGRGR